MAESNDPFSSFMTAAAQCGLAAATDGGAQDTEVPKQAEMGWMQSGSSIPHPSGPSGPSGGSDRTADDSADPISARPKGGVGVVGGVLHACGAGFLPRVVRAARARPRQLLRAVPRHPRRLAFVLRNFRCMGGLGQSCCGCRHLRDPGTGTTLTPAPLAFVLPHWGWCPISLQGPGTRNGAPCTLTWEGEGRGGLCGGGQARGRTPSRSRSRSPSRSPPTREPMFAGWDGHTEAVEDHFGEL